ncbi:hypothetical protein JCM10450v2_005749 [Rhodotorula kratochvilovae]
MLPLRANSPVRLREPADPRHRLPLVARFAPLLAVLLLAVVVLSSLHPSPWLDSAVPIFRRPPPPRTETKIVQPVSGCRDTRLTTLEARENAAVVVLVREGDLAALLPTLSNFEARFNAHFRYPYVFLASPDEGALSPAFRTAVASALPAGAETQYGVVPPAHWSIPPHLSAAEVRAGFAEQEAQGVQYAGREGYHHMCRWYAGLWVRHELLQPYDWFWRLEPGVRFFCTITYDPFRFLALHNKVYGFVIAVVENMNTIPGLFGAVRTYLAERGITPRSEALWRFLVRERQDGGEEYGGCHFWSNFEIGNLRFFRSQAYQDFFRALDDAGGFYTERWGDAPVRALALGALASMEQIHYFDDIGYQHDWFFHCAARSSRALSLGGGPRGEEAVGCDCQCPKEGELQGREKGQETVDMDKDWRFSCLEQWKAAVRRSAS